MSVQAANVSDVADEELPVSGASAPASESVTASSRTTPRTVAGPRPSLRAVFEAGLGAGIVFLLMELLTGMMGASTPMGPARVTLKGVFDIAAGQATTLGIVGTLGIHFTLAFATTAILATMVHHWKTMIAGVVGMAFGGLLYTTNVTLFAFIAPSVTIGGGLAIIVNYMLFGIAAALLYKWRQPRMDADA